MPNSEKNEVIYNLLGKTVGNIQQQNNLSNAEVEGILLKVLDDIKSARLIEDAKTILQLKNKIAELEKGKANDKPNDQS